MASTATLANLLRQGSIDDHEELLAAAEATLRSSKSDIEAQHVKVVALLKLDRYEEALRALETGGSALKERAQLEHAYALYKTGKPEEAAALAHKSNARGSKHVEAQSSYRSEDFRRAAELYAALSKESGDISNESVDLRINSSAVDAQLEWALQGNLAKSRKPGREDLEAFETAYNAACGSIARGELGQAEVLLKRSKDLCNALDDLSEDEKKAELLPITVQQIYVLCRLNRVEDAQALCKTIDATELTDATSKQIAEVNAISTAAIENPFILQRQLQSSTIVPASDKPFGFQASAIKNNLQGISLSAQKYDGTIRSARSVIKTKPAPTLDAAVNCESVLLFAATARNLTGKVALKQVQADLAKRPKDVGLVLVAVQLYVLAGNNDSATTLLEKFLRELLQSGTQTDKDVRYAPGLVATIIALYTARSQTSHVRGELSAAASYWLEKVKSSSSALTPSVANLLKVAGGSLLASHSSEDEQLVQAIFEELCAHNSSDAYTAAGLIASSTSIPQSQLEKLTPVERLVSGISASDLEEAGVARPPQKSVAAPTGVKRAAEPMKIDKKAKKPKPSKLPKDYDENKKVDPERWLPLKDRSGYRPKKKGKGRSNMLAQGAVDEISRPGTPGTPVEKASGGVGGKQAANKKKKAKGNKW